MNTNLFSVQQRRPALSQSDELDFIVAPQYVHAIADGARCESSLGVADAMFAQPGRRPTLVELLVLVSTELQPERFVSALREVCEFSVKGL